MKTPYAILLALMLLLLPLSGVWVAGYDTGTYLEFPPRTQYVEHATFSATVFIGLTIAVLAAILPFLITIVRAASPSIQPVNAAPKARFPWWGWAALAMGILVWFLAWTRFPWFDPLQPYTFTPLWLCYIVAVNALTYRRTGRSLLTHHLKYLFWLFPLSALFWWIFEYLNRFVQNWWYTCGSGFTPMQYFIAATLPFSTVLPAVLSTEEWLSAHPRCCAGLDDLARIKFAHPKTHAWLALVFSSTGLFLIGRFPDWLFPLLWVAPLLLLLALRTLSEEAPFFSELRQGDFRRIFRFALAALICGFFWEMWNWHSLAKWIYSIPYVDRFHLFEMPVLGYAGYLPFGLECAAIASLIRKNGGAPATAVWQNDLRNG